VEQADGTYNFTNISWIDTSSTKYWISFNVTDGIDWTNQTFNFTTAAGVGNNPSTQSGEVPVNGSTDVSITPSLYVVCSDSDAADTLNATWWSNSTDGWQQ